MTLEPLIQAPLVVQAHVALALAALACGLWLLVFSRKGAPGHRAIGTAFMALMTVTALGSFLIRRRMPQSPVFGLSPAHILAAFTLFCVWRASIVFGIVRDAWNPLGRRDRGYLMIFGPVVALVFAWLAVSPLTYNGLFVGMLVAMCASRFQRAAYQGLIALIGQEKLMSGRLTVVWQVVESIPAALAAVGGGWMAQHLQPSTTFVVIVVIALCVGVIGLLKPAAVFRGAYEAPLARGSSIGRDLKRLLRHRAVYPAVLVMFLFQFAPGSNTPLLFYLTDKLHASREIFGWYFFVFVMAFVPVFFFYGWLCKRVSLEKLLWWGTVITIPQMIPLAFIHTPIMAVVLALPIGMMGGIAAAAYYDLAMRSCPSGLQGTLMMAVDGGFQLSYRGGDWVGARIYGLSATHGFLYCVLATSAVYALILPVLLLIPRDLIRTPDGERNPELDREAAAALAGTD